MMLTTFVERREGPAFHIRLLDEDEGGRIHVSCGEHLAGELHVLAGIRRSVFNEHAVFGHAHANGYLREPIGFRIRPQVFRDHAQAAGEDDQRRPTLEKQLRAPLGHDEVVAAKHQDSVGLRELMIQLVVAPDPFHQRPYVFFHRVAISCSARCSVAPSTPWFLDTSVVPGHNPVHANESLRNSNCRDRELADAALGGAAGPRATRGDSNAGCRRRANSAEAKPEGHGGVGAGASDRHAGDGQQRPTFGCHHPVRRHESRSMGFDQR